MSVSSAQQTSELGRWLACFLEVERSETLVPSRGPPCFTRGRTEGSASQNELGGHLLRLMNLRPLNFEWRGV